MSKTNKLIEAIVEHLPEAVVEMIGHAAQFGDREFIDQVAEALNIEGEFYVVRVDGATDHVKRIAELEHALNKAVQVLSNYAAALNCRDNGGRLEFDDGEAFLARLRSINEDEGERVHKLLPCERGIH